MHFFADPDVFGRRKGVAIIECRKGDAGRCAVGPPGHQAGAAGFAENPLKLRGGGIAGAVALNGQSVLRKQRAGEERRSHRFLALAAVTDADVDRFAPGLDPNRAAEASAFPDHGISAISYLNTSRARRKCRTPRRWRRRNLPTPATPPSPRVLPPARNVPSE